MNLQGTIGIVCICIVLVIFFPPLFVPIVIIAVLNFIAKASEAHDRYLQRKAEMPGTPEPLAGPFVAEPPHEVF